MTFGKSVLASLIGTLLAFIAGIGLVFFMILGAVFSSLGGEKKAEESGPHALHLTLQGSIQERGREESLPFQLNELEGKTSLALDQLKENLEQAQQDEDISGLYLDMRGVSAAPSTLRDVRTLLEAFKQSGKWIVAYGENYTQADYYLASVANEVYMYPTGMFDWRGMNGEVMFFKKLLDELEVEAQVIRGRDNKYKSAVEPFMYEKMSDPNREQMKALLDGIWGGMVSDIAASRKINADSLHQAAITLKYVSNGKLMEDHLVDGLLHLDEVHDKIRTKMGIESGKELPLTEYADYAQPETPETEESTLAQAGIAVVYAVGAIESGEGDDETIGSDRISEALRQARLDENVKAVVLRVNSPGGSALASDVIWRETQLIKASGKPLVVSMGDYAASGGYYISCAADKIFANPNTITGSIGVFGVIPNLQNLFDHKLGITFDRYETAPHADFLSINKPFDEVEKQKMNDMIVGIYDDFLNRVSTGRNMEVARVDSMARGRVWTGLQAKEMGLVDEIGGLQEAIQAAAKLASLEASCPQLELPKQEDPWSHLMGSLAKAKEDIVIRDLLGDRYAVYRDMRIMLSAPTVQARLPFVLEIN